MTRKERMLNKKEDIITKFLKTERGQRAFNKLIKKYVSSRPIRKKHEISN